MEDKEIEYKHRWRCPMDFLYLELHFLGDIPMAT